MSDGHVVRFSGHSDDCFEIEGAVCEEVGEPVVFGIVDPAGQRINVVGTYSQNNTGMWMIGLQTVDDDDPWPDWPMGWRMAQNQYSPELSFTLPSGTAITQLSPAPLGCKDCGRPNDPLRLVVGS
jgi:hypothetical protein